MTVAVRYSILDPWAMYMICHEFLTRMEESASTSDIMKNAAHEKAFKPLRKVEASIYSMSSPRYTALANGNSNMSWSDELRTPLATA